MKYYVLVEEVKTGLTHSTRCDTSADLGVFISNIDSDKFKLMQIFRYEDAEVKPYLDFCKKEKNLELGG